MFSTSLGKVRDIPGPVRGAIVGWARGDRGVGKIEQIWVFSCSYVCVFREAFSV